MATVTRFPSTDTAVSGTWTNPTNIYANDGAVASTTVAAKNTTSARRQGGFGFDGQIPVGSTINSVSYEVDQRVTTTAGIANLNTTLVLSGTAGTVNSVTAEPTTLTVYTYSNQSRPGGGSWTRADLLDGTFFTEVRAVSGNDATSVTYEWDYISVTVDYTEPDTIAPTVSSTSPTNGATGASVTGNIVFTFDENIARGTGTITLRTGSASGTIIESYDAASSSRLTISGATLTIDPTNNLSDLTTYFVVIPSGAITDTSSNAYAGTSTYSFTTGDFTAPTVSTFSPASGSTTATVTDSISLTFNETVQRGTGTITLRTSSASGTIIESFNAATSDRISISGSVFTIDPTSNLSPATLYYLVIPSGAITDTASNAYTGTSTYSFTTAASLVFPTSPTVGDTFTLNARKWQWDGTGWQRPLLSKLGDNVEGSFTIQSNVALHAGNFNSYAPTLTGTGASGTWSISVTGNAGTVTNGVYTTGSYADPAWITSLAGSKISGNISGSAATLTTGRTIGMTGDVTWTSASFNGSANVTGTSTLANSGVTAGTYGSATQVPVITVDAKGRVTAVTPTDVSGGGTSGQLTWDGTVLADPLIFVATYAAD